MSTKKLLNISSGVALCDGIAESILNIVDVGKSRTEYFTQKRLTSKEISFHALIKKNNSKSFCHAMRKIRLTKNNGSVKVVEVKRKILGTLNSYSLKTWKPGDFKLALPYFFSPVPLNICNPKESRRHVAKAN